MTRSQTKRDQNILSHPSEADTETATASASWQTITEGSSTSTKQPNEATLQFITANHPKEKRKARPEQPEDEFFYEQAKFFRHLERRHHRFAKTTQEDEQRARQGKLKVRKAKAKPAPAPPSASPHPGTLARATRSETNTRSASQQIGEENPKPTTEDKSKTASRRTHSRHPTLAPISQ